jgi:hypothetical protein
MGIGVVPGGVLHAFRIEHGMSLVAVGLVVWPAATLRASPGEVISVAALVFGLITLLSMSSRR